MSSADAAETSKSAGNPRLVRRQQQRQQHPPQPQRSAQQHATEEGRPPTPSANASASASTSTGMSSVGATISSGSGGDFSDMPSLSSYSAKAGDCDTVSLPSLSSFRFDEVSMASSYHSRGSAATNHISVYSEESNEGWGSFTSGNVSKSDLDDTDDDFEHKDGEGDEDIDEDEFASALEEDMQLLRIARQSGLPPIPSRGPPSAIETKSILRNRGEGFAPATISASQLSLASFGSSEETNSGDSAILKSSLQATRSSNSSLDDSLDDRMKSMKAPPPSTSSDALNPNTEPNVATAATERNLDCSPDRVSRSPVRGCIDRNESMPFSELLRPSQERLQQKNSSSSSFRYSPDGSSSSLRGGGDSLPRLPRRTSTMRDDSDDDEKLDYEQVKQSIEHELTGEKIRSANDEASPSDSSSSDGGLSLEIGGGGEDESADCSVETVDDNSICLERTKATSDDSLSGSDVTIPSDTERSIDHDRNTKHAVSAERMQVKEGMPGPKLGKRTSSKLDSKEAGKNDGAPVAFVTTSTTASFDSSPRGEVEDVPLKLESLTLDFAGKEAGTEVPGSKSHIGEESGTSGTEAELEDPEEAGKQTDDVAKKRNLIRRMSSSLRKVGKSASFRESFRSIGKTASKIRQISFRKDKESGDASSRSGTGPDR